MHVGALPAAAALIAAASVMLGGEDQRFEWVRPGGLDVCGVALGSDGELLLIDSGDGVWWGPTPLPERLDDTSARAAGWRRRQLPPGFRSRGLGALADGMMFVTGQWATRSKDTLLRFDTRSATGAWEDLAPPVIASIYAIEALDRRRVWISGEWRDVFRLEDDQWVREVTPQPLHNEFMQISPDETGWVLASSRSRTALLYRDAKGWRTVATEDTGVWARSGLLFADADEAIVQDAGGIVRIPAPGRAARSAPAALPGTGAATLTLVAPDSGWAVNSSDVARIDRSRRVTLSIVNPIEVGALRDLGAAGIYARDRDSRWILRLVAHDMDAGSSADAGLLRPIVPYRALSGSGRPYGLTVFRLGEREHVYVVDHEGLNSAFEIGSISAAVREGSDNGWSDVSRRLGTMDVRRGSNLGMVYDAGAVAADLDGDGDEDLILVSMYDGIREFRNERDDHFISWAREAHIDSDPMDLASGACLLDADADGDLDLYVANGLTSDRLHLNDGAGTFHEVTAAAGIDTRDGGSMPACSDLDGDGDTDVVVATSARGLLVQENLGPPGGVPRFREHRFLADRADLDGGPGLSTLNLSSVALGDLDHDGLPEIFAAATNSCDLFLWNRGELRFELDRAMLPEDAPCAGTFGAEWVDLDADGRLDVAIGGREGLRARLQRGKRLVWSRAGEAPARPASTAVRSIALADFDRDGDPDILTAIDGRGVLGVESVPGKPSSMVLRVVGPPGNRSAVGARVLVRRHGQASILAARDVPGSSSRGSQSTKLLYVSGLDPAAKYDLELRIPGRTPRVIAGLSVPYHGSVAIQAGALSTKLEDARWQLATFLHDPWRRRWLLWTVIATLALGVFAALLFRDHRTPREWLPGLALAPVLSIPLRLFLPLDSGLPITVASVGTATLLSGVVLALGRARSRPRPTLEAIADCGVALRAFGHSQVIGRYLSLLKLDLRAAEPAGIVANENLARYVLADVRGYQEAVVPELSILGRRAHAAGLESARVPPCLRREADAVRVLSRELDGDTRNEKRVAGAIASLLAAIEASELWRMGCAIEVDRALATDLRQGVGSWLATRREVIPGPVRLHGASGAPIYVRFPQSALRTILDNLLDNSVRATASDPSKAIEIEIQSEVESRPRLVFRDEGPGVAPGVRTRLFTFGNTTSALGHGFGLHYVRSTAERYGATVEFLDGEQPGAAFRLTFDAVRAPGRRAEGETA